MIFIFFYKGLFVYIHGYFKNNDFCRLERRMILSCSIRCKFGKFALVELFLTNIIQRVEKEVTVIIKIIPIAEDV